ncbi:hypothetical protein PENTCL1PPCAC_20029, partial [Pristionchus entomophagus]
KAGLALRCKCGIDSISLHHARVCRINEVSVIRTRDGPIQRLYDNKTTPQCVLCEVYPTTPYGYAQHLYIHHNSNGIFLVCSCGQKLFTRLALQHINKCNGRQFSLHQLDKK